MEITKRIIIDITSEGEPSPIGPGVMKVKNIRRTVSVDYDIVYSDRMKADIYYKSLSASDLIRNLEMFLSGLEQRQSREDSRTDSGKFIGRVKMVWGKLFGKKV